jgi:hypothetical protein
MLGLAGARFTNAIKRPHQLRQTPRPPLRRDSGDRPPFFEIVVRSVRLPVTVAATTGRIWFDRRWRWRVGGYAARAVLAFPVAGVQFQGSKVCSSCVLVCPETMRWSTSVSHAIGSTPLSFAVWMSVIAIAQ